MKILIIGLILSFLAIHNVQGQTAIAKPAYCPIALHRQYPEYPEILKRAGFEGIVEVSALVDENGIVEKVKIIKSTANLVDTVCLNAAKRWKFKPGKIADCKGIYVKSKFWYSITFDWSNSRVDLIRMY